MRIPRWTTIVRALAAGPALACVGYFSAVLTEVGRGSGLAPFTPEFHHEYEGMWVVLGVIGLVLGLVKIAAEVRSDKGETE